MRLWYQTMSRQVWGPFGRTLRELIEGARGADTEIELHGADGDDAAERATVLANLDRAVRLGFDGFLVGGVCDPGLAEARAAAEFPVVALGETAFHVAALMAPRYALIAVDQRRAARLAEIAAGCGLAGGLAAVEHLPLADPQELQRGFDDTETRQRVVAGFERAAAAAQHSGAEAVIAGDSRLMALLAHSGVDATADGTPVVDAIASLVKLGEMAVKVNRILGGRFTPDRLAIAVELLRSYDAIPPRVAAANAAPARAARFGLP